MLGLVLFVEFREEKLIAFSLDLFGFRQCFVEVVNGGSISHLADVVIGKWN